MLTATDNVTELDISELVDMEKEPGCEHSSHRMGSHGHQGSGWGIVRFTSRCGCKPPKTFLICQGGYEYAITTGLVQCTVCHAVHLTHDVWTLVSVL